MREEALCLWQEEGGLGVNKQCVVCCQRTPGDLESEETPLSLRIWDLAIEPAAEQK